MVDKFCVAGLRGVAHKWGAPKKNCVNANSSVANNKQVDGQIIIELRFNFGLVRF